MPLRFRLSVLCMLWLGSGAAVCGDIKIPSNIVVPPQAEAGAVQVLRGQHVQVDLRAHYGGSNSLHFVIVRRPAHGHLSEPRELGDNRASITYTQDGSGHAAEDSFSYLAQAGGRSSAAAEVRVEIVEAPAQLAVPDEIDFGEIVPGASAMRELLIRNAGGGVLEGRLTASSPWVVTPAEYRVEAGATEKARVTFQPDGLKKYVGQITLADGRGGTVNVSLTGKASSPPSATPTPTSSPEAEVETPSVSPVPTPIPEVREEKVLLLPRAATPVPSVAPVVSNEEQPEPAPEGSPQATVNSAIRVTAHRSDKAHWELQWAVDPDNASAGYRVAERILSLDKEGNLLTNWREVPAKVSVSAGRVTVEIHHLDARELHMLRISALAPDGSTLWEAPLVALQPERSPDRRNSLLLLGFALLLAGLLYLRWCARHVAT